MKKFIVGGSVIVLGYLFYKFSTLKKSEKQWEQKHQIDSMLQNCMLITIKYTSPT